MPPCRGYQNEALYPASSGAGPAAPFTTSSSDGLGMNRPPHSGESSSHGTV